MRAHNPDIVVVYVTTPEAVAADIARRVVEDGVAACVNIIPQIRSIYRWKGEIQDEREALLAIKTSRACFPALEKAVLEVHPNENPEIIAVPIDLAHAPYAAWVEIATRGRGGLT